MTSLLILLACTSLTTNSKPVAAKDRDPEPMATRPAPEAKAVVLPTTPLVQEQCFASGYESRNRVGAYPPPPSPSPSRSTAYPGGYPAPTSPPTTASAAPMAKSAPQPVAAAAPSNNANLQSLGTNSGGAGIGGGGNSNYASGQGSASGDMSAGVAEAQAPGPAPKAAEQKPTSGADKKSNYAPPADATAATGTTPSTDGNKGYASNSATKAKSDAPAAHMSGPAKDELGRRADAEREKEPDDGNDQMATIPVVAQKPAVPEPDWGATVYLSNDDSMSLASAQRLLWALQNHAPVKTSEIRPHELLNYFSFDTAEVKDGQVFSALGAAEQTAPDTLTVSFAVKGYNPPPKPLDLTLVLDRSGSMAAEGRMEYLKRGLLKMTQGLHTGDRVDLILFDNDLCSPLQNFVVGRDDMNLLTSTISQIQPRGSTNLGIGLGKGYTLATGRDPNGVGEQGRNKRMMLITDALMNEGQIDPNILTEIGKGYLQAGVNLTAVGVGTDFNDKVLDQLSEKGHGAYVYLGSEAVVDRVFGVGLDALTRTIARDVHFSVDLPPSLAMERFYGEESSTDITKVQPINYFAGTSQLFLQDLKIRRDQVVPSDPITFNASWVDPETGASENQSFHTTVGTLLNSDVHNLVKGRALMAWSDLLMTKSLGGQVCGAPMDTWRQRVSELGQDSEITWLDGLTSPLCGQTPVPVSPPPARTVALKVKLDSDMPIAEVGLVCGGSRLTDNLGAGDQVATFQARPGSCQLTLQGNVPMTTTVQVPETGADLRCVVRGGRFSCT